MEKIDQWLSACDEEKWLEDYNQDQNHYSAGRGAHINLKCAERARIMINKIPAMVDNLISKTLLWEDEKQKLFLYDGDQKKLQDMLLTEKESIYGSKPSPRRSNNFRTQNGYRAYRNGSVTPSPRRNSVGCATPEVLTPHSYSGRYWSRAWWIGLTSG